LQKLLEHVKAGDTLYIERFSRLARSLPDLLAIIEQLNHNSVGLVSLKEQVNTTTPAGLLQLQLFRAIANFERETARERQQEGIKIALAEKRPYGRPKAPITTELRSAYLKWKKGKITAVKAMQISGVKRTTFYKLAKQLDTEYKGIPLWSNDDF